MSQSQFTNLKNNKSDEERILSTNLLQNTGASKKIAFRVSVFLVNVVAFLPLVSMIVFIAYINNVFVAMFFMHWGCMIIVPYIYTLAIYGNFRYYSFYLKLQSSRLLNQLIPAFLSFLVFANVIIFVYLFTRWTQLNEVFFVDMKERASKVGFTNSFFLYLMGGYFTIINPVIEEVFWRIFLYREIFNIFIKTEIFNYLDHPVITERTPLHINENEKGDAINEGENNLAHIITIQNCANGDYASLSMNNEEMQVSEIPTTNNDNQNSIPITLNETLSAIGTLSIKQRLVLCLYYVSYHFIVLFYLVGIPYTIAMCFFLGIIGLFLTWMIENSKFGLLSAILAHVGVDLGVVIVYADLYFCIFFD